MTKSAPALGGGLDPPRLEQEARPVSTSQPLSLALGAAYLGVGVILGVLFITSEVASWYRIQEMFRFDSLHMFGIIGSALVVAAAAQAVLRRWQVRSLTGEPIATADKQVTSTNARYWLGGTVFGLGWGLLGACPGPIFALIGAGQSVYLVALASAVAGTYAYARLQRFLPH